MTEKLVKKIINEEIDRALREENPELLEEGMVDFLKNAWSKTKGAAGQGWESIKQRLGAVSGKFKQAIQSAATAAQQALPGLQQQYQQILAAQGEAGEQINIDGTIKQAQQLAQQAKGVADAIKSEAQATQQVVKQTAGQAEQEPTAQQEAFAYALEDVIYESLKEMAIHQESVLKESREKEEKLLNEFDAVAGVSLTLGGFGGIKLVLHGLNKLFGSFGNSKAQALAHGFHSIYNKAHKLEVGILDKVFPDKVAYAFYKPFANRFSKGQVLSLEQFAQSQTKHKVKKYMYTVILLSLFASGVVHLLHASYNFLFAAEAGANTVKAIEIGEALVDAAQTALSSDGAGAAFELVDMADIVGDAASEAIPDMTADAQLVDQ